MRAYLSFKIISPCFLPQHGNIVQGLENCSSTEATFPKKVWESNRTKVTFRQHFPLYPPCYPSNLHILVTREYVSSLDLPPGKLDRARRSHKCQPIPRSLNTLKPYLYVVLSYNLKPRDD